MISLAGPETLNGEGNLEHPIVQAASSKTEANDEEVTMITRRTFQTGLLGVAAVNAAYGAEAPSLQGRWSGVLDAGAQRLRLKLEIDADGAARISSLDQ